MVCPVENAEPLLYFSTDTDMRSEKIIGFYRTRFQIEFGIRDAKQFTGLQSQQTRDRERLDFAFNLSFTALNVCKEVIRKDYPDLSVAQFKTAYVLNLISPQQLFRLAENLRISK